MDPAHKAVGARSEIGRDRELDNARGSDVNRLPKVVDRSSGASKSSLVVGVRVSGSSNTTGGFPHTDPRVQPTSLPVKSVSISAAAAGLGAAALNAASAPSKVSVIGSCASTTESTQT